MTIFFSSHNITFANFLFFHSSCDKLTNNLIESMLELEPPNYEQDDISLVFEKNNFLSARGRRVGEIIAEKFDSE